MINPSTHKYSSVCKNCSDSVAVQTFLIVLERIIHIRIQQAYQHPYTLDNTVALCTWTLSFVYKYYVYHNTTEPFKYQVSIFIIATILYIIAFYINIDLLSQNY